MEDDNKARQRWLDWAMELQALAQTGLAYSESVFNLERFERIREIAAEMLSAKSGLDLERVKDLFCGETGFQTPKMDTRAAIFQGDGILLVREKPEDTWALPGGWVEMNLSVRENTVKEVKEEAGLDVVAERLIAVQDRKRHNRPLYAYEICKIFVLCRALGGSFQPNAETTESGYFPLDGLPELTIAKNTAEQIALCFEARKDPDWRVVFD